MSIWIRRIIAVPLGLVFMWLLIGGLLIVHVQGSLLSPDFHKDQLEKADAYNFVLDDLPRTAVKELREEYPVKTGGDQSDETTTTVILPVILQEAPESLRDVVPPEWLQEQVEQVIEQVGEYLTGRQDEFYINVPLRDRAIALSEEVRRLLPYDTLYDHVMAELVRPGIEDELEGRDAAPFGEPITTDEVVASLERTFPKDWVSAQADAALDEVTAYLVGVKDSMTIRIALDERADTALDEVKTLLRKADDFEIVFEGVINPVLDENVPEVIYLPLDVTITREEVKGAFLDQVPLDWLREQSVAVVDEAGPYFIGRRNDFQVVIPMDERKDNAERVVSALAQLKADEVVRALPECEDDATTLQVIEQIRIGSLPQCIPPGLDQRALDILLDSVFQDIDLDELLRGFGYEIPDRIVYTQQDLREALYEAGGQEALDALDGLRKAFREGWTYTDADLKAGLISEGDESDVQTLEDVRELLRDGWTFTHTDLRQSLRDSGGEEAVSGLDRTRDMLSRSWLARLPLFLIWIVLLAAIGFLGGRTWWSRLAWASAVLSISALAATLAYTVALEVVVPQALEAMREEALRDGNPGPTAVLMVEKASSTASMVADSLLGDRVRTSSVMLLVLGLASLLTALIIRRLTLR